MNAIRQQDLAWTALVLSLLLASYWTTLRSMAEIWSRSQTFAHGFLIFPVSAWMVWRQRTALASLPRAPSLLGLLALAGAGAIWLAAAAANVQIVQQFCLILMIASSIAAVLGWAFTLAMAFPLAYLLLAVPSGEILIPALMDYTASFVTSALRLVGIPVFRDHNSFSLPSGNWSVVEACSGLRYMIAALALGLLYAYLNFQGWRKRLVFTALATILPIAANGARAFLIVLLGHYSDMRLATGIDHLLYGWIFFGLVMSALFYLGRQWRDPPPAAQAQCTQAIQPRPATAPRLALTGGSALALLLAYAMAASHLEAAQQTDPCPKQVQRSASLAADEWQPLHKGCYRSETMRITIGARPVLFYRTSYRHQGKQGDMLAEVTREREPDKPLWRELPAAIRAVSSARGRHTVQELQLSSEAGKRLVWRWYRQSGVDTSSAAIAKLILARSKLTGADDAGDEYALATPCDEDCAAASNTLQAALTQLLPTIDGEPADVAH